MMFNDYLYRLQCSEEINSPLRRRVTDKEFVKDYVREKVGDEFNVPTLAVLRSIDEAMTFNYPHRCVIKSTHGSGHVILRKDGELIDFDRIRSWLQSDYYLAWRERYYRNLERKIIVEPFVFDIEEPDDYKVFCWRGEPRMILVVKGRFSGQRRGYFDAHWNRLPFSVNAPPYDGDIPKPMSLDNMLAIAKKLSSEFSFIRVDFYTDGRRLYVGELTNVPNGGANRFIPSESEVIASRLMFSAD